MVDFWNTKLGLPVGETNPATGQKVPADGNQDTTADTQALIAYKKQQADVATGNVPLTQILPPTEEEATDAEFAMLDQQKANEKPKFDFDVKLRPQVQLGPNPGTATPGPERSEYATRPLSELQSQGYLGADTNTANLVQAAAKNKPKDYEKVYQKAVVLAAIKQKSGDNVTVESLLTKWAKSGVPDSEGAGGAGGAFSTTTRSVTLTNESTSRGLLNQTLAQFLGRTSTVDEQAKFLKALNIEEKANPTITNQSGFTSGGNTSQNVNTSGGSSSQDFADRFAKSQEGYAEYQTATTYLDAFIKALENPARII